MVSVVLVTHNRGPALVPTILGIRAQTCRPMEIVVVENGCTDETAELLRAMGTSCAGLETVRVRLSKNVGVGFGRNAGARAATGEVLVWMDDDSRFEDEEALSGLAREFSSDPTLAIRAYPVREQRGNRARYLVPRALGRSSSSARTESSYFLGGACAMRTAVFRDLGMFDGSLFYQLEELEFSYRLALARIHVRFLTGHPVVVHMPHGNHDERRRRFYYFHTRNRIWLARRFLPVQVAVVHLGMWLPALFLRSVLEGRSVDFRKGFNAGTRRACGAPVIDRTDRLDKPTLRWLARRAGRVWF